MPNIGQTIKLNLKTKEMIKQLGRRGSILQVTSANTLNDTAKELEGRYKTNLKKNQTLRNEKFTLGGIRTFKAQGVSRSGQPRQLHKINAITGVMKMKGGAEHYLSKLESGGRIKGNRKTKNRVPVPLQTSRISKNVNRPVAGANRLMKEEPQNLTYAGNKFGVPGDRLNPRQRFALLYKEKRTGAGRVSGDLKKPFFFTGSDGKLGIFRFIGNRARKVRLAESNNLKLKARPNFEKAVNKITPASVKTRFVKYAGKALSRMR